jgi:hypothetical protein
MVSSSAGATTGRLARGGLEYSVAGIGGPKSDSHPNMRHRRIDAQEGILGGMPSHGARFAPPK